MAGLHRYAKDANASLASVAALVRVVLLSIRFGHDGYRAVPTHTNASAADGPTTASRIRIERRRESQCKHAQLNDGRRLPDLLVQLDQLLVAREPADEDERDQ